MVRWTVLISDKQDCISINSAMSGPRVTTDIFEVIWNVGYRMYEAVRKPWKSNICPPEK